ncbi:hypothetical protein DFS34DRAFT_366418 [Phlyctochytrium arcticum]|nr:hypothetical protein DFS34DRAFT_366418 [Phlyctochytrium arcticum]
MARLSKIEEKLDRLLELQPHTPTSSISEDLTNTILSATKVRVISPTCKSYQSKEALEAVIKALKDCGTITAAQASSQIFANSIAPKVSRTYGDAKGSFLRRVDGKSGTAPLDQFAKSIFKIRGARIQDTHRVRAALVRHYRPKWIKIEAERKLKVAGKVLERVTAATEDDSERGRRRRRRRQAGYVLEVPDSQAGEAPQL